MHDSLLVKFYSWWRWYKMTGRVCVDVAELFNLQHAAQSLPLHHSRIINSSLVGRHKSVVRGRGLDFEELRHYKVGDDIRHMDWKLTKRTGKPHVRVYVEEREQPVLLIVDQRLPMFFGSKGDMKSVVAAKLAALLAWHTLSRGDRIGGLVFGDDATSELRPRKSQSQIMHLFNVLCDYNKRLLKQTQTNTQQLNAALQQVFNLAKQNTLLYVISDFFGADNLTGELLTQLQRRNKVIVGFIYDPLEQQLPKAGKLAVSDGQYQLEVNTDDTSLRLQFEQMFQDRLLQGQDFLSQRDIAMLPINTVTPVAQQLSLLLGLGCHV